MPDPVRLDVDERQDTDLKAYRDYITEVAGAQGPSEIILNRSSDHAAVIVEFLFHKADAKVEILTGQLDARVYGTFGVIDAARTFLSRNPSARLEILAEQKFDTKNHPLIVALRSANLHHRVDLSFVPPEEQKDYSFHFAVADKEHFRFEKTRDRFEAIVQFGENNLGARLHAFFCRLSKGLLREPL